MRMTRTLLLQGIATVSLVASGCVGHQTSVGTVQSRLGTVIGEDDFDSGLGQWIVELEQGGSVTAERGRLEIDVPAGATLWLKQELSSPVAIMFEATAVDVGGPNDRVSDINAFWMARNRDGSAPFTQSRGGAFAEYNDLLTYYVGLGGNWNTTTRFRRYIGHAELRPMLPEHDLSSEDALLTANQKQTIVLVANENRIEYWRDGVRLLHYDDPAPYTRGWVAIRTTRSHLRIERLRIHRLEN